MRLPPRDATAEGDLTIPFQQSALKSTADQDPFFQHLKIRYVKATDSSEAAQVDLLHLFWLLIASKSISPGLCCAHARRYAYLSLHSVEKELLYLQYVQISWCNLCLHCCDAMHTSLFMHAVVPGFASGRTHSHTCLAYSAISISLGLQSTGLAMLCFACLHATAIDVTGSSGFRGVSVVLFLRSSSTCMHTSAHNTGGMHAAGNGVTCMAAYYPKCDTY